MKSVKSASALVQKTYSTLSFSDAEKRSGYKSTRVCRFLPTMPFAPVTSTLIIIKILNLSHMDFIRQELNQLMGKDRNKPLFIRITKRDHFDDPDVSDV